MSLSTCLVPALLAALLIFAAARVAEAAPQAFPSCFRAAEMKTDGAIIHVHIVATITGFLRKGQ
jgi:hypothetical protein